MRELGFRDRITAEAPPRFLSRFRSWGEGTPSVSCRLPNPQSCTRNRSSGLGLSLIPTPTWPLGRRFAATGHPCPVPSRQPGTRYIPFWGPCPPPARACGPLPCRECQAPAAQCAVISVAVGRVSLPPSPVERASAASRRPDPYLCPLRLVPGGCHQASAGGGRHNVLCGRRGRRRLSHSADGGLGNGLCRIGLCPGPGTPQLPARAVFECPGSPEGPQPSVPDLDSRRFPWDVLERLARTAVRPRSVQWSPRSRF